MKKVIAQFYSYLLTQKRVSNNTYISYKTDLQQFVDFLSTKNILLEKATRQEIKDFLSYLAQADISARSRSRKLSCLKSFYTWAVSALGWKDVTLDIPFPSLEKKLPIVLSEQHIKKLLESTQEDTSLLGKRNQMLFYLLYATGMRVSELVQTRVSDIQFDSGFLTIKGKGGKERIVPLPEPILIMLRSYLEHTWPHLCTDARKERTHDYLFPVVYGKHIKPMSRQICWLMLKQLCKHAGISTQVSPHQLRHSLATHLLKKGIDLRSLQVILGHETIGTVQVYTHLDTAHLRKIYDKKHPRA